MGNMFVLRTGFQKEQDRHSQPRVVREGVIFVTVRTSHSSSVCAIEGKNCLVLG